VETSWRSLRWQCQGLQTIITFRHANFPPLQLSPFYRVSMMSITNHFKRLNGGCKTPALALEKVSGSSGPSSRRTSSSSTGSSLAFSHSRKRPLASHENRWSDDGADDDDDFLCEREHKQPRAGPTSTAARAPTASSRTNVRLNTASSPPDSPKQSSKRPTCMQDDLRQQAFVAVTKVFRHEGFRDHQVRSSIHHSSDLSQLILRFD